jgi:hypothetical protein
MDKNCNNCYFKCDCFWKETDKFCELEGWMSDYNTLELKIKDMQIVINQCKDTFEKIIPMEMEKLDCGIYLTKSGKLAKRTLKIIEEFENEELKEILKNGSEEE